MANRKNTDTAFEDILREFSSRIRKDIVNDNVRNLEFVSAEGRESFAWGFDSALSMLGEIAQEHGVESSELGLKGMPISGLVKAKLP